MNDAEKLAAVEELVNADGFGLRLAEEAIRQYEKSGRGFWFCILRPASAPVCNWMPASDAGHPGGEEVARKVAAYDPRRDYVLFVVHVDGTSSSYTMRSRPVGRG